MRSLVTAVVLVIGLAPALGDVRILASPGGDVVQFLKLFEILKSSGERVIIDGPCYSACTLVLSEIPHNQICVTSRAVLGFHAPRVVDQDGRDYDASGAKRLIAATYPAAIRAWIEQHGGLAAKPIFLRGRALAALYSRCGWFRGASPGARYRRRAASALSYWARRPRWCMIANVERLTGAVPFAGDLFDVVWRANRRNVRLSREYLEREGFL
jgi:hypothetical protein